MGGQFGGPGAEKIVDPIQRAIDMAKQAIKDSIADLWKGIVEQWNKEAGPSIKKLSDAWNGLVTIIGPIWENIKTTVGTALGWIQSQIGWFIDVISGWWSKHGENLILIISTAWNFIKDGLSAVWDTIKWIFEAFGIDLDVDWSKLWEDIKTTISDGWEIMKKVVSGALDLIGAGIDIFATLLTTDWAEVWDNIKLKVEEIWLTVTTTISTKIAEIKTAIGDFIKLTLEPLQIAWSSISTAISNVIDWIGKVAAKLLSIKLPKWLNPGSPTPFEMGLLGIGDAMERLARSKLPELKYGLSRLPTAQVDAVGAAARMSQPISTRQYSQSNTLNMPIGPVNINNGMDEAMFVARVRAALNKNLGGSY